MCVFAISDVIPSLLSCIKCSFHLSVHTQHPACDIYCSAGIQVAPGVSYGRDMMI